MPKKIVINRCFGGFGLSEAAVRMYAERKGLTLYPEAAPYGTNWWLTPPETRPKGDAAWVPEHMLYDRDIPRTDADLVAVVEALGKKASGKYADLGVVEVPDDVKWEIDEYDGNETVAETHRTWR